MRWVPSPGLRVPELDVWEVDWGGTGPGVSRLGQTLKLGQTHRGMGERLGCWQEAPGGEGGWDMWPTALFPVGRGPG